MSEASNGVNGCYSWREYERLEEAAQPWLVESLLPVEGSAVLAGPPKARKTYLALQLALCLAEGKPWLGFRTQPAKVLFLQIDTPRTIWKLRFRRLQKKGVAVTDAMDGNLLFADSKSAPFPFNILQKPCAAWLRERCTQHSPTLVIVDTLSKAHTGDEDKRDSMELVTMAFKQATMPATLLFITHERKGGEGHAIDRVRGSGALTAGVDLILNLRAKGQHKPFELEIKGRETEDMTLQLTPQPTFFFATDPQAHWHRLMERVAAEHDSATSDAARCLEALARDAGIDTNFDACRKRLQRMYLGE